MIPGILISIVTFPGVIVHELAHLLFCKLFRVAVYDVCYFRVGNPSGYVVHEHPRTPLQSIFISIGPFLVNTILGAIIALPAAIPVLKFDSGDIFDYVLIWLGVSIAMHSFPSTGDAKSLWASVTSPQTPFGYKIMAAPICLVIFAGAIGSFFWLDLGYGVVVALALPELVAKLLA